MLPTQDQRVLLTSTILRVVSISFSFLGPMKVFLLTKETRKARRRRPILTMTSTSSTPASTSSNSHEQLFLHRSLCFGNNSNFWIELFTASLSSLLTLTAIING